MILQVCECLNRIERRDLSEWLSKSVFQQLQKAHEKSIGRTGNETDEYDRTHSDDEPEDESNDDEDHVFSVIDFAGSVLIFLSILMGIALCVSSWTPRKSRRNTFDTKLLSQKKKYSYKYATDRGKLQNTATTVV